VRLSTKSKVWNWFPSKKKQWHTVSTQQPTGLDNLLIVLSAKVLPEELLVRVIASMKEKKTQTTNSAVASDNNQFNNHISATSLYESYKVNSDREVFYGIRIQFRSCSKRIFSPINCRKKLTGEMQ